jgi:septal ring factor EnvC (AmiA/AmiB activator)
MGLAALAHVPPATKNRLQVPSPMSNLHDQIRALISASTRDLDEIERTLTDGYAQALSLEAERSRLQRRLTEVAQEIQRGDMAKKARELTALSERLDGNQDDLAALRGMLGDLRRHADDVRVGSPSR